MKRIMLLAAVVAVSGCAVRARTQTDIRNKIYAPNNGQICILLGAPPGDIKYDFVGKIVASKRTYGSSEQLYPAMAYEARKIGADAIINLQAGQRFKGPLPWRVTAPTGTGQAIKLLPDSPPLNCMQAGGQLL